VHIDFDDVSNFNADFGNLVTTKSEIDKHAELLQQAVTAGKSVASNASNWQKAVDKSNSIDKAINEGLQDAVLEIGKANGQNIEIGQYGIWGKKVQENTIDQYDPEQFRMINNKIVFTSDNWKTAKSVFGKFTYNDSEHWGVLADAVVAGYIEGSEINGGTISGTNIIGEGGSIAGWNIKPGKLYAGGDNTDFKTCVVQAPSEKATWVFAAGGESHNSYADCPFRVSKTGKLYSTSADISGDVTIEGEIKATDGSIAGFGIGSGGCYDNALYKRVDSDDKTTNYEVGMKATSGDTDLAFYVKQKASTEIWDNATNTFFIRNNGAICATSGTIGGFDISKTYLRSAITKNDVQYQTFMQAADGTNTSTAFAVRTKSDDKDWDYQFRVNYDGSAVMKNVEITGSSTIAAACIPNLSANKITSGTLDASAVTVKNLNASNITSGTLDVSVIKAGSITADYIGGLPASQITSGTLDVKYLSSSVLNTENFSTTNLTTKNLQLLGGCKIAGANIAENNDGVKIYYGVMGDAYFTLDRLGIYMEDRWGTGTNDFCMLTLGYGKQCGKLWGTWEGTSGIAITSDENKKNTITKISELYEKFFDNINSYTFKYNDGTSDRLHCGFIAQRVKESLDTAGISTQDFGGLVIQPTEDGNGDWYIRYDEFIPLNTWQIQKLKARVTELENKLSELESKITE
jgi:hypothetical protein